MADPVVVPTPAAPIVTPVTPEVPAGQWYDSFTDAGVKTHAVTKQWATPEDAVRSNLNLEKLIGVPQDQILKLPKADADAAEWNPIYDRLGRPKTAEEYALKRRPAPTRRTRRTCPRSCTSRA